MEAKEQKDEELCVCLPSTDRPGFNNSLCPMDKKVRGGQKIKYITRVLLKRGGWYRELNWRAFSNNRSRTINVPFLDMG